MSSYILVVQLSYGKLVTAHSKEHDCTGTHKCISYYRQSIREYFLFHFGHFSVDEFSLKGLTHCCCFMLFNFHRAQFYALNY